MSDIQAVLVQWQLDVTQVREQVYRAPTSRERERWHAIWLLARGWSLEQVGKAPERDKRPWLPGMSNSRSKAQKV